MDSTKMFDEAVDTLYTLLEKATGSDNLLTAKGAVAFGTVFGRIIIPKLEELEAENVKLRTTLREIANDKPDRQNPGNRNDMLACNAYDIARDALNDKT